MNEILQTIQLSKRFGKIAVLDRMDMSVPEGSVYGLVGPNGAGKSTTLQILMNIDQASAGHAEVLAVLPCLGFEARGIVIAPIRTSSQAQTRAFVAWHAHESSARFVAGLEAAFDLAGRAF